MVAARLLRTIHYIEKDGDWHITLSVLLAMKTLKTHRRVIKSSNLQAQTKLLQRFPSFFPSLPFNVEAGVKDTVNTTLEDEGGQVRAI